MCCLELFFPFLGVTSLNFFNHSSAVFMKSQKPLDLLLALVSGNCPFSHSLSSKTADPCVSLSALRIRLSHISAFFYLASANFEHIGSLVEDRSATRPYEKLFDHTHSSVFVSAVLADGMNRVTQTNHTHLFACQQIVSNLERMKQCLGYKVATIRLRSIYSEDTGNLLA